MNPTIQDFARRLIAHDAAANPPSLAEKPKPFSQVYEKLREPLATFTGAVGLRPLVHRALVAASKQVPWLDELQIRADGFLECPPAAARRDQKEIARGEAAFLSNLLGLLVTFLGTGVTLRVVRDVWPEASIADI